MISVGNFVFYKIRYESLSHQALHDCEGNWCICDRSVIGWVKSCFLLVYGDCDRHFQLGGEGTASGRRLNMFTNIVEIFFYLVWRRLEVTSLVQDGSRLLYFQQRSCRSARKKPLRMHPRSGLTDTKSEGYSRLLRIRQRSCHATGWFLKGFQVSVILGDGLNMSSQEPTMAGSLFHYFSRDAQELGWLAASGSCFLLWDSTVVVNCFERPVMRETINRPWPHESLHEVWRFCGFNDHGSFFLWSWDQPNPGHYYQGIHAAMDEACHLIFALPETERERPDCSCGAELTITPRII